jgi:hypothetical protein
MPSYGNVEACDERFSRSRNGGIRGMNLKSAGEAMRRGLEVGVVSVSSKLVKLYLIRQTNPTVLFALVFFSRQRVEQRHDKYRSLLSNVAREALAAQPQARPSASWDKS